MEEDISKDSGPNRPIRDLPQMPNFEHIFKKGICTRCKKTSLQAKFTICDADAYK